VDAVGTRSGVVAVKAESHFNLPLLQRKVGKLVVAELVRQVLGVGLLNDIVIVGEVLEVVNKAISGRDFKLVFRKPVEKLAFVVRAIVFVSGQSYGDRGCENNGLHHF